MMAADYKRKVQSDNKHLSNLTSARNVHIDGNITPTVVVVPLGQGSRLERIVINTKGLSLTVRTGSRIIGLIATTVAEGTLVYGVYCENGIQIDVGGSGGSVTVAFGD